MEVNRYVLISLVLLVGACNMNNDKSDAYGQFEATEVMVSAEGNGKLLNFKIEEGQKLTKKENVGVIDTTQLVLRRDQIEAQMQSARSKLTNVKAEAAVIREQKDVAMTDLKRIKAMYKDQAATQKQLDDAEGNIRVLNRRIQATETQRNSILAEINALKAQKAQVVDQVGKAEIINPVNGRVLTKYVEPSELVHNGSVLYKIANLDTLELRAYVSGAQLPKVKLGQKVNVLIDKNAEENESFPGRVSWVSDEAEFTPKMIQTKEERVTQVYAVKIRVPNDGTIKIGMPGEVNFPTMD